MIDRIILITPIVTLVIFICAFVYAGLKDKNNPPEPIHYVWRNIYPDYKGEWDKGNCTLVYVDAKTNVIRGKVVKTNEGLYLATMWNGQYKEFIYEYEATKSVEEYKVRVYK